MRAAQDLESDQIDEPAMMFEAHITEYSGAQEPKKLLLVFRNMI
jgi:hypothetical protein